MFSAFDSYAHKVHIETKLKLEVGALSSCTLYRSFRRTTNPNECDYCILPSLDTILFSKNKLEEANKAVSKIIQYCVEVGIEPLASFMPEHIKCLIISEDDYEDYLAPSKDKPNVDEIIGTLSTLSSSTRAHAPAPIKPRKIKKGKSGLAKAESMLPSYRRINSPNAKKQF